MLHSNLRKEKLSECWFQAVATACGVVVEYPKTDMFSIDAELKAVYDPDKPNAEALFTAYPELIEVDIKVQLKSTAGVEKSTDRDERGYLNFPLSLKNYNDLRAERLMVPRMLVVLQWAPEWLEKDYVRYEPDQLILRGQAYWFVLKGMLPSENTSTVTVKIPRRNVFNPEQLQGLFRHLASGQDLTPETRIEEDYESNSRYVSPERDTNSATEAGGTR